MLRKIVDAKLVSTIVACYMNDECSELESAIKFLIDFEEQGAIECIAHTNMNLLVSSLVNLEHVLTDY